MWYCMQGKRECQEERGIFEKFWPRGGGEGYFAGDEWGWGATPSPVHSVYCVVVLCFGCAYLHTYALNHVVYKSQ